MLMTSGGWERRLGRPSREEGSFFSCSCPLHSHPGSSQSVLGALPSPFRARRASGLASPSSSVLRAPYSPTASQQRLYGGITLGLGRRYDWIPTLPARRSGLGRGLTTTQRALAHRFPPQESQEPSSLLTSCQFIFLSMVGRGRRRGMPPSSHLLGGGGRAESGARRRQPPLPSPQRSESVVTAAAAAAAAWAAWGGCCASPRRRSAGDLNATETVIHHRRSRQTLAGGLAIGWRCHVPIP